MKVLALIQARMSSSRFPGKVLAPLNSIPLIQLVYNRVNKIVLNKDIIVLTSNEPSDDPLFSYLAKKGINVYRGSLDNVFLRFKNCLIENPCNYFFRVCADSPYLEALLFQQALSLIKDNKKIDIVTNKMPPTFPPGKSIELIKTKLFTMINENLLTSDELEHVTKYFYNHSENHNIYNIENSRFDYKLKSYAVDEVKDLKRLENIDQTD